MRVGAHKMKPEYKVPSLFLFAVCCEQTFTSPGGTKTPFSRKISSFFSQTIDPLLRHSNSNISSCDVAQCCCHLHIISQLTFLFADCSRIKKETTHIQTLKQRVLWFNGAFVFQCFFWPICMKWFIIFIIDISNHAEQRVLLVWLYFSFINECTCKVSGCVCLLYCYLFNNQSITVRLWTWWRGWCASDGGSSHWLTGLCCQHQQLQKIWINLDFHNQERPFLSQQNNWTLNM